MCYTASLHVLDSIKRILSVDIKTTYIGRLARSLVTIQTKYEVRKRTDSVRKMFYFTYFLPFYTHISRKVIQYGSCTAMNCFKLFKISLLKDFFFREYDTVMWGCIR